MSKKNFSLIKTDKEIEVMKTAGVVCSQALKKVLQAVCEGVICEILDKIASQELKKRGASPSFATVDGYRWTICTTVNEQVVHGIPGSQILKEGDIVGVDIGAMYQGYHSDMAKTVPVGKVSENVQKFLSVGFKTLQQAISKANVGNRVGDISETIQEGIESADYSIVKNLTGHGIGRKLHEEPMVPGFGKKGTGPELKENMVLAIEVIYTAGTGEVELEKDGWTIVSADGSLGGLFEQTIAVTKNGPIVLTPY